MKLRLTGSVSVTLDIPEKIYEVAIAPMIFLPFVENAFKHGTSAMHTSFINIQLQQEDHRLTLTVVNSSRKDNSVSLDTSSGIGMVNTRRRLDLLYAGRYRLDIQELPSSNTYSVHLALDLS